MSEPIVVVDPEGTLYLAFINVRGDLLSAGIDRRVQ
jgi:hypothetical protein